MMNVLFTVLLGVILTPLLWWAHKTLPNERWQIIAAIPVRKDGSGRGFWQGANITSYGFLLATGSLLGVLIFFLLLASVGVKPAMALTLIGATMIIATAAAKLVAMVVEKKRHTFTVAGGAIAGLFLMPPAIFAYNFFRAGAGPELALLPVMAALATAYALGEGVGRLACISFGCCYGKPLLELGPLAQKIFARFHTTFHGDTKKIVYASGLAGVKVVPIQAVTSFLYVGVSLVSMYLFLEGYFAAAFGVSAGVTLGWRVYSEQLRADYRGHGSFSAYQRMSLAGIVFSGVLLWLGQDSATPANLAAGLASLWNPAAILFLQLLWLGLFLYTGLSKVTGATVAFHVRREQV